LELGIDIRTIRANWSDRIRTESSNNGSRLLWNLLWHQLSAEQIW